MEVHLIVLQKNGRAKKVKLLEGELIIIGRSPKKCQVPVDDGLCSNTHCKISLKDNSLTVEDLKSKNGVYLNGVKILKQNVYLNDKVTLGQTTVYLNKERMHIDDIQTLTHNKQNHRSRETGNVTLELAMKNEESTVPTLTSIEIDKPEKVKGRQVRTKDPRYTPATKMSQLREDLLYNLAYLLDIILGLAAFCIIFLIMKNFVPEIQDVKMNANYIKFLFSEQIIMYTIACIVSSFAVYRINRRLGTGSIGEKILKLED